MENKVTARVEIPGWSGDIDHLRRIVQLVDDAIAPSRALALSMIDLATQNRRAEAEALVHELASLPDGDPAREYPSYKYVKAQRDLGILDKEHAKKKGETERDFAIEGEVVRGDLTVKRIGTAAEVVEPLDVREQASFGITAPSQWPATRDHTISLRMDRRRGVSASISGTEKQWVLATAQDLRDELNKGLQRLAWARTWRGTLLFVLLGAAVGTILGWSLSRGEAGNTIAAIMIFVVPAGAFISGFTWELVKGRWSTFELLEPGAKPRAVAVRNQVVGIVVTAVFSFLPLAFG